MKNFNKYNVAYLTLDVILVVAKVELEYSILTDDNIVSMANADIFHMSYKDIIFLCMKMVHEGI